MLAIQYFIKHNKDWEEKLSKPPFCLKITRDLGVIGFMYNHITSDFSELYVREARGLWLYENTFEVACHSFDKFFNYKEPYADNINWIVGEPEVEEKIDGSLMKVWYNKTLNDWILSTNGTIDATKATTGDALFPTFWDVFQEALKNSNLTWNELTKELNPDNTYTFEMVSPQTRVVIPYEKPYIYFIGVRNNSTNNEFNPDDYELPVKRPKKFPLTNIFECLKAAKDLPWDKEGFVVVDKYFHRVKIKSSEWVKAHLVRGNGCESLSSIVDVILNGEQEEFLVYANEYKDLLKATEARMSAIYNKLKNSLYSITNTNSQKEYAELVKKQPKIVQNYLFSLSNESNLKEYISTWTASKWVKILKEEVQNETNA